ncbi:MAG: phage tail length tape measure family protein [Burkholderiaceae bacterium]|nr:phage tail length tape measure family protein [Burkholderiaceae bacterium]
MATQLEAHLRIRADTAQAAAGVRQIKTELQGLGQAAGNASAGPANVADLLRRKLDEAAANARKLGQTPVVPRGLPKLKDDADAAAKALQRTQRQAALLVPQLNDIFTQLASGTSPLTVLVQQGPQIRDVMGSWSNAGKALLSVFTPLRVAIGGVLGVAATFALAAFQGAQESRELGRAIAFTGNAAGVTAGQVEAMTTRIAESTKQSRGDVRATLTELIATGRFTSTSLDSAARGVDAFAKLTGRSRAEAVSDYAAMADGVTAWATKYDRALNFLTAAQLRQIRQLESLGRTQEAVRVASDALADAAKQRHEPALGVLERAWRAVGLAVSGVWEALKSIGRDNTAEQEFQRLQGRLQTLLELRERATAPLTQRQQAQSNAEIERARAALQDAFKRLEREQGNASGTAEALAREQEEKRRLEAGFQSAQAQQANADAAKRLAQLQARLDRERDAVQSDHARGLLDERAYQDKLAEIEVRRLQAQADNLRKQRETEAARDPGTKPEDRLAQAARLAQLDAQIIDAQSRATTAAAQRREKADADALAEARTKATEWAAVWLRAEEQVRRFAQRNAVRAAEGEADPVERARLEADAAVAETKRVFEDAQIELKAKIVSPTLTPGERAELQKQLDQLTAQATKAIAEDTRRARFDSLVQQFNELAVALATAEQQIDQAVEQGLITTEEAERRKIAARETSITQLERIRALLSSSAQTPAEQNTAAQVALTAQGYRELRTEIEKTARGAAVSGLATALTDIETGAKRGKDALLDMVGGFAKAMLDVLNRKLAEALVKQFADAAASGGFGSLLSTAGSFIASFFHSGGVVGAPGGMRRAVPAAAFTLAPRFHGGGVVPGLMPGERPIVARVGETIRTEQQERALQRSLGGVQITNNMTITGDAAQGGADGASAALDDLARVQEEAMSRWAIKQMRPGGLFSQGQR